MKANSLIRPFTVRWQRIMKAATGSPKGLLYTFLGSSVLAFLLGYLLFTSFVTPKTVENAEIKQSVVAQEKENATNQEMARTEPQFRAEVVKAINLYEQAQPMMPTRAEVGGVLAQVQSEATRQSVTLSGLNALKPEAKSPGSDKFYQREYPAVVTGTHAQVVRFLYAVSKLPRIVLITDFTETSLRQRVSVSFTLLAFNAPPPTEIPKLPDSFQVKPGDQTASAATEK